MTKKENEAAKPQEISRKKRLTVPLISMAHRERLVCRITSEIRRDEIPGLALTEDGKVPVVDVIDLETGEESRLIVGAVIESTLMQLHDYQGKCFEMVRGDTVEGKRYRPIEIYEVEVK